MKKLLILLMLVPVVAFSQSRFKAKNSTGAASTDTLSTTAFAVRFIESISINTAVASDTIIVGQVSGVGATAATIATFILGATPVAGPVSIPLHIQPDSAFVTIQRKKTSDVTTVWSR